MLTTKERFLLSDWGFLVSPHLLILIFFTLVIINTQALHSTIYFSSRDLLSLNCLDSCDVCLINIILVDGSPPPLSTTPSPTLTK